MTPRNRRSRKVKDSLENILVGEPLKIILHTLEKHPKDTIYSLVKKGKSLEGRNGLKSLKTELVYNHLGIEPDTQPDNYSKAKLNIHGIDYYTDNLFKDLFPSRVFLDEGRIIVPNTKTEKLKDKTPNTEKENIEVYLRKSSKKMIESVFGEGISQIFNYAHQKHLKTGAKRKGANFYFAHIARVAYKARDSTRSRSQDYQFAVTSLALLHDVVEGMHAYRQKRLSKEADRLANSVSNKVVDEAWTKISELKVVLRNPPELKTGHFNTLMKSEELGKTMINMVKAVSNHRKNDYEHYIRDLFTYVNNQYKIETSSDEQKKEKWYDMVPLVKLYDAIDNTNTLHEADANDQEKRLSRNIILAEYASNFLLENDIDSNTNNLLFSAFEELVGTSYLMASEIAEGYNNEAKLKEETEKAKDAKMLIGDSDTYRQIGQKFEQIRDTLYEIQAKHWTSENKDLITQAMIGPDLEIKIKEDKK